MHLSRALLGAAGRPWEVICSQDGSRIMSKYSADPRTVTSRRRINSIRKLDEHHDPTHGYSRGGAAGCAEPLPEGQAVVLLADAEHAQLRQQRLAELELQMPSFIRGDEDEDAAELFSL